MSESPKVQFFTVSQRSEGQRLDNFLFSILKGVPKSLIYRNIRTGSVRVDKKRCKQDYRLKTGEMVRIPPIKYHERKKTPKPDVRLVNSLKQRIVYEDEHLLALDKPANVPVHAGSGMPYGIIDAVQVAFPDYPFLQLVHRLDRETSGCLLLAKSRTTLVEMQNLFRTDQIKKTYFALTMGAWKKETTQVDLPLKKNVKQSGERMVKVFPEGKTAFTEFKTVQYFRVASLMEVKIKTGRTHQIRVHAQASNHPIAGDTKYGDKEFNQFMKECGLKRLFLHAARLEFTRPSTGNKVLIQVPLSPELQRVLQALES